MEEEILKVVSKALEVDLSEISIESTSNDFAEWDSLGHLNLLNELDNNFNNVADRVPELASVSSVKEIVDLITSNQ
jgi:acyl carrier protein